ncbi:hypothetical protein PIIN_07523 [Serendipita indica DSM 11827]|uniref:Uncharacterized protein n=1 Tax=Serendipita indica (strain DSM 11827) TaxID=1109443 RepID=G4TQH8_SERID|nr:hypothetical protein PIIN_07523 [Serendipita indica DSM 11827]
MSSNQTRTTGPHWRRRFLGKSATHVDEIANSPGGFPVEIWRCIFDDIFDTLHYDHEEFLDGIAHFSVGEYSISRLEIYISEWRRLSLTCRYFYSILRHHTGNRLTLLELDATTGQPRTWKQASHQLKDTERLESMGPTLQWVTDIPVPIRRPPTLQDWPPHYLEDDWVSLHAVLADMLPFHLPLLLDRASNLELLSCVLRGEDDHEGHVDPILSHPRLSQLTHLSIVLKGYCLLKSIPNETFPNLRFLRFSFQGISWRGGNPGEQIPPVDIQDLLPWTLPSLKTLVLGGSLQTCYYQALMPFFLRQTDTVANLINNLLVVGDGNRVRHELANSFPNLRKYGACVSSLYRGDMNFIPSPLADRQSKPITLIFVDMFTNRMMPRTSDAAMEMNMFMHSGFKCLPRYTIKRIMVPETWYEARCILRRMRLSPEAIRSGAGRTLSLLQNWGLPVVDRLQVEMPVGQEDWLFFPEEADS